MSTNSYQEAIHRDYSQAVISIGYLLTFCSDPSDREALLSARAAVRKIGEDLLDKFSD